MNEILWLNQSNVQKLIRPEMVLKAVHEALVCHALGQYQQPLKPYIRPIPNEKEHRFIAMPACLLSSFQVAGIKWISGFPSNLKIGLQRAAGIIILNSLETGFPIAIMDCAEISAARTAAVATISINYLAKHGSTRIALLGAGPIAAATIKSISVNNPGQFEFVIFDPNMERVESLAKSLPAELSPSRSVQECVNNADVVVTATSGSTGYLRKEWIATGALIVALSLDDATEDLFLSADKMIVDDYDQCNRENKLLHRLTTQGRFSKNEVYAELGEIISGNKPGRENEKELIYINPMGMAIEDIATAYALYLEALKLKIGTYLN